MALDEVRRALYYTTSGPPGSIIKMDLSNFARLAAIVLNDGDGRPTACVMDSCGAALYLATEGVPPTLLKVDLMAFQLVGRLQLTAEDGRKWAIAIDGPAQMLYLAATVGLDSDGSARINRVDLTTFTASATLALPPGFNTFPEAAVDALRGYLYILEYRAGGRLVRVRTSDMSFDGAVELPGAGLGLTALMLDTQAGVLYVVAVDPADLAVGSPSTLSEVRLSDFTVTRTLALSSSCRSAVNGVLDAANGYLYVMCQMVPSAVAKVRLADLSTYATLPLSTGESMGGPMRLDSVGGELWVGTYTNPGMLIRLDLSAFQRSTVVQQYPSQPLGVLFTSFIDPVTNSLYLVGGTVPHTLARLRLPTLGMDRQVIMSPGEEYIYTGLIDPTAGFLYLASAIGLVRVRMQDMSRLGLLPLLPAELADYYGDPSVTAATFGADRSVAFFGMFTSPGVITRVDLRTYHRQLTVTLAVGLSFLAACAYDAKLDLVFCGTYTIPKGMVVMLIPSTLQLFGTIVLPQAQTWLLLTVSADYLIAVTYDYPVSVTRLQLHPGPIRPVVTKELPGSVGAVAAGAYDAATNMITLATAEDPGVILTMNATSLAVHGMLTFDSGNSKSMALDPASGDTFVALGDPPPALLRLPRTGVSDAVAVVVPAYGADNYVRVSVVYNGHIFFGGGDRRAVVTRVRLSDMSYTGSIALSAVDMLFAGTRVGRYGYFAALSTPGKIFRVDLESFSQGDIFAAPTITGLSLFTSVLAHEATEMLYVGVSTTPSCIISVSITAVMDLRGTIYLPAGFHTVLGAVMNGNVAYYTTFSVPPFIAEVFVETPTQQFQLGRTAEIGSEPVGAATVALHAASQTLFIGLEDSPGKVVVWDVVSFARTGSFSLDGSEFGVPEILFCPTDQWMVMATTSWPATLVAADRVSLQRGVSWQSPGVSLPLRGGYCDAAAGTLYFASYGAVGTAFSFNASTLQPLSSVSLVPGAGEGWLRAGVVFTSAAGPHAGEVVAVYGTYLGPGMVLKVRLRDMVRLDTIELLMGEFRMQQAVADATGRYVYITTDGLAIIKIRVDTYPMERAGTVALQVSEIRLRSLHLSLAGYWLYATAGSYPSSAVRISTADFQRVDAVVLQPQENDVSCSVLDTARSRLYMGTATSPSRLITVDLVLWSRRSSITLPNSVAYLRCAALDTTRSVAYFGSGTSPGRIAVVAVGPYSLSLIQTISLQPGEISVRHLAIDQAGGFLYAATDTAPAVIVQFSLATRARLASVVMPDGSARLSSLLFDAAHASLLAATEAVPSRIMQFAATPGQPAISAVAAVSKAGIALLTPSVTLCSSLPMVGGCIFASPQLHLSGAFFGSFLAAERANVTWSFVSKHDLSPGGVWQPGASEIGTIACEALACPSGSDCECAAILPPFGQSRATLTAVIQSAVITIGNASSVPYAVTVFSGAPALLRCRPAIIAQHRARLMIDAALDAPFNAAEHSLWLSGAGIQLPCSEGLASADGQTLSCSPPPLSQAMLGVIFDVQLRTGDAVVATLHAAVQYAWPVLAAVEPSIGLPTAVTSGSPAVTLVLQSPALAGSAELAAWIGSTPCSIVSSTSEGFGALSCVVDAGVGVNVVVTVAASNDFNVTSFEAVPAGQPMSQYDGQFSIAPTAPRMGLRTTISFAVAAVLTVEPAVFVLTPFLLDADNLRITMVLSEPLQYPGRWVSLLVGQEHAAVAAGCDASVSAAASFTCGLSVASLRSYRGAGNVSLSGSATLPLRLRLHVPDWPAATAVVGTVSQPLVVHGTPVIYGLQPASGREGSRIAISGAALALSGDAAAVSVTVNGAACTDLAVASDALLYCTAPPFDTAAAVAGGNGAVDVIVSTPAGSSPAVTFMYANQLHIAWADGLAVQAASVAQLPGLIPLQPLPAILTQLGVAVECWLSVVSAEPADSGATLSGVARALAVSNNASATAQTLRFPAATIVADGAAAFTVAVSVSCRDAQGYIASVPEIVSWRFVGLSLQWTSNTVAVASRQLAPAADGLASPSFTVCPLSETAAPLNPQLVAEHVACSIAVLHGETLVGMSTDLLTAQTVAAMPGCVVLKVAGIDLAMAAFGSALGLRGSCTWKPTQAIVQLQPLELHTLPVAMSWLQPPPAITESQALLRPAPAVQAQSTVPDSQIPPAMQQLPLRCTLAADVIAIPDSDGILRAVDTTDTSAAASIVVSQTAFGRWNDTLAFDAFSVAGRRLSRYNATAACTLGQQALPLVWRELSIAGCDVGQEPGGSTGWMCNACAPGTYSDGGAMACRPCPPTGASCSSGALQLQPGFFLASAPAAMAGVLRFDAETELHGCFNSEACTLNTSSRAYGCSQGYGGPLCGVCQPGYTLFGQTCVTCWPAWGASLLVTAIAAVLIAAVSWLALFHKPGTRSPASIALRQLIGFIQMLNIVSAFRQQAAGLARSVLGWTDAANASLLSFGPLGCLFSLSFLARFALTLALPVAFGLAVAGLTWLRQHSSIQCAMRCGQDRASAKRSTSGQGATDATTQRGGQASASLTERLVSVMLLLTSLLYMPLLSACLRALDCYDRPIAGVTYLRIDLRVTCGVGQHFAASILAWVVLAVLGIGFPAFILGRLCWCRACCRLTPATADGLKTASQRERSLPAVWRPLYDGYDVQRGTLWWEAVVLLRKAVLAVVGTFLGSNSLGVPVLSTVLLISLGLQEAAHPYEELRFNWGERVSLGGALAASLLATLYGNNGDPASSENLAVTASITVVTVVVLLALALQWVGEARANFVGVGAKARGAMRLLSARVGSRRLRIASSSQPGQSSRWSVLAPYNCPDGKAAVPDVNAAAASTDSLARQQQHGEPSALVGSVSLLSANQRVR